MRNDKKIQCQNFDSFGRVRSDKKIQWQNFNDFCRARSDKKIQCKVFDVLQIQHKKQLQLLTDLKN